MRYSSDADRTRLVLVLSGFTALMASCVSETLELMPLHDEVFEVRVEVEAPEYFSDVKSSYTAADLNRITDLNVFVYHEGRLLAEHCGYFNGSSPVMLSFPYDKDVFNIYMIGNVGKIEPPEEEGEIYEMCHMIGSYAEFRTRGFPIANVFPYHVKGTTAVFKLKRLIGQYDIMLQPSATDAEYVVKDVRIMNCALDVYPFNTQRKATSFMKGDVYDDAAFGDSLTAKDLQRLNNGEKVSLYFVENLQGELLPGNTDRRKKVPSVLGSVGSALPASCTYIEITADVTTSAAKYTDGRYRFYLGQNQTTDFSIRRNTLYEVTLDFTQNMVSEEEWRIEVDEPQVQPLVLSKEEANVVCGVDDYILIDGPEVEINTYKSDESDSDYCAYSLSDVVIDGKKYQKLVFSTMMPVTGLYTWGTDYKATAMVCDVTLETVEKYNGKPLASKTVSAYVYDKAFPLFLRMGSNGTSAPYRVEGLTDAPVQPEFEISAVAQADVTVSGTTTTTSCTSTSSMMGTTSEGIRCCHASFAGLYDTVGDGDGKIVKFRRLDVTVKGKVSDYGSVTEFYMGDGGKAYWGPGPSMAPEKFADLTSGDDLTFTHSHWCMAPGCINYTISSGSACVFVMAPKGRTCNTVYTTGTSNSLSYDVSNYSSGKYIPFYIANGDLNYFAPVTMLDEDAKYLDDSARKSIIFEMQGPGRDVFYPNGVVWGGSSENSPGMIHRFGYTAGLTKQFFGNIHTWQIYQNYECDFYMTVNGCTSWPGASTLSTGFVLTYNL